MADDAPTITEHELSPFETNVLDVADCSRLELVIGLTDFDRPGHRFETWPAPVQREIEKHVGAWLAAHPEIELRAVTTGVHADTCVMILHYRAK